ncbi:hypothetical protein [Qipengyuania aquimaris]|uniref:hypothetical protein n=1 Tax=Qipengyuania aquimaris TaxID=255984 RepID=UPI001FD6101B|nr:hypothetical protein [Qipengyuania aquimaris]UOR14481.1 hypothetical protein LCM05_08195 [Qipengyuania aquimaris]
MSAEFELSDQEKIALREYKCAFGEGGRDTCFSMNAGLRRGLKLADFSEKDRKRIESLESILSRVEPRTYDEPLYRGIGLRIHLPLAEIGAKFRNLEFWSTSRSRSAAEKFLNPVMTKGCAHGAILKLTFTQKVQGYDLESLEGAGGSEQEFLLPRGILWTVGACRDVGAELDKLTMSYFQNVFEVELSGTID